mmetsp:Transcript_10793/g.22993  ORF Transcript_10793/g.22993 Transcript_10793/m.22993 type:complete len:252 (-) Transcript_10793:160-915(-)
MHIPPLTTPKVVAVIFAVHGGMGDVGKFALAHALQMPGVTVRAVGLCASISDETLDCRHADVTLPEELDYLDSALKSISLPTARVGTAEATALIQLAVSDADAVIACVGNRQPQLERCGATGMRQVIDAMSTVGVGRLVALSSMGINTDYLPTSFIKVFWACLLRTYLRSAWKDLLSMETVVQSSNLNYVIVRPMGLSPEEPSVKSWKVLTAHGEGGLKLTICKSDVAAFMLQEAVSPAMHNMEVTIGQPV